MRIPNLKVCMRVENGQLTATRLSSVSNAHVDNKRCGLNGGADVLAMGSSLLQRLLPGVLAAWGVSDAARPRSDWDSERCHECFP